MKLIMENWREYTGNQDSQTFFEQRTDYYRNVHSINEQTAALAQGQFELGPDIRERLKDAATSSSIIANMVTIMTALVGWEAIVIAMVAPVVLNKSFIQSARNLLNGAFRNLKNFVLRLFGKLFSKEQTAEIQSSTQRTIDTMASQTGEDRVAAEEVFSAVSDIVLNDPRFVNKMSEFKSAIQNKDASSYKSISEELDNLVNDIILSNIISTDSEDQDQQIDFDSEV